MENVYNCLKEIKSKMSRLKTIVMYHINPKYLANKGYRFYYHKNIDWNNPQDFFEKIFWMEIFGDTSMWTLCADKYLVRKYVEEKGLGHILNELYGVWDRAEEVSFDALPNQFVLKTNHSCGQNLIVKDKKELNQTKIRKQLNKWLRTKYGYNNAQKHYLKIKPKIIAEKLLIQDGDASKSLVDYKFNCFNGEPYFCSVFSDRQGLSHKVSEMLYDMQWKSHPEWYDHTYKDLHLKEISEPNCFGEMKEIAKRLSEGFKFVRVDLYVIDDKPIFGELTFTPGFNTYYGNDFMNRLGDLINLDMALN